jgi:hypothetical protein
MAGPNSELLDELARLQLALDELWEALGDSGLDADVISGACGHVESASDELACVAKMM